MELYDLLFETLRAGLFSKPLSDEAKNKLNDEETVISLFRLAKKHDIAHLFAHSLIKTGLSGSSKTVYDKCEKACVIAVYQNERMGYDTEKAIESFEKNKIPFVLLKGAVIKRLYPEEWMRTSADVDILTRESDVQKASDVMTNELGCEYLKKTSHDVQFMTPGGTHFEIHYKLVEEDKAGQTAECLENVWDELEQVGRSGYCMKMNEKMTLFYHLVHMAKHLKGGGCGIKPFLDLYYMNEIAGKTEDRDEFVRRFGMEKLYLASVRLCSVWFEGEEYDEQTERLARFVLSGGVFGNLENNVAMNRNAKKSSAKYAFSRVFAPYDSLKYRYPELEKKKWLFVPYQFRRWFDIIAKGDAKNSVDELKVNQSISEEKVADAAKILDDLGI